MASTACTLFGNVSAEHLNAMTIATSHAIADTGATSIFVMEGVDVDNKRVALKPLTICLPDGRKVHSTHECDINIPGLPTCLTGHSVPHLAVASLIGIRPLCKAGCTVTFDDNKCDVIFQGNVILRGYKDAATDLWTLPLTADAMQTARPRPAPIVDRALHDAAPLHPGMDIATFTHSIKTRANGVKFAHQSLCSPKISTLLKAVRKGFLRGCPNMTEKLILKYLNPSPATSKGHMKRPRHGIRSTGAMTRPTLLSNRRAPASSTFRYCWNQFGCRLRITSNSPNFTNRTSSTRMSLSRIFFATERSPTKCPASCITTSPVCSPLFLLMAACASW